MGQTVLVTELEPMITPFLYAISLAMEVIIVVMLTLSYIVLKEVYARRKQGIFNMLAIYTNTNPFEAIDTSRRAMTIITICMWLLRISITYAGIFLMGKEQAGMFSYGTLTAAIKGQADEGVILGAITVVILLETLIMSLAKRNKMSKDSGLTIISTYKSLTDKEWETYIKQLKEVIKAPIILELPSTNTLQTPLVNKSNVGHIERG